MQDEKISYFRIRCRYNSIPLRCTPSLILGVAQFMFSEKDKKIKTTRFLVFATATTDVKNIPDIFFKSCSLLRNINFTVECYIFSEKSTKIWSYLPLDLIFT